MSQATFGAPVAIVETAGRFSRIVTEDRYSGWSLNRWLAALQNTDDYFHTTIAPLFADIHTAPQFSAPLRTRLTVGSRIILARSRLLDDYVPLVFPDGMPAYTHRGNISLTYENTPDGHMMGDSELEDDRQIDIRRSVVDSVTSQLGPSAKMLVGTPYLWGGTTPFGIDCSGFTQLVYRLNGILLLRDSAQQLADRRLVPVDAGSLSDAVFESGDLVFFGQSVGKVTHVGMALGDGSFIHAAGSGRGVLVSPTTDPDFAPTFIAARRLSPDADLSIDGA